MSMKLRERILRIAERDTSRPVHSAVRQGLRAFRAPVLLLLALAAVASWTACGSTSGDPLSQGPSNPDPPHLSISTKPIVFPDTVVGTEASAYAAITLYFVSSGPPLHIYSITYSGDFYATTNCPQGGDLAVGSSCETDVYFEPTHYGFLTGQLTFNTNADNSTVVVPLQGNGI